MTKAISINIGLNYVDANAYGGWNGQLAGCVNDAKAMQAIAQNLGYLTILILNEEATADRIISEIGQAAWNLEPNGIFLLTYSGHGGQMADVNGDEDDGKDETWVLYDRQLIDDELVNLWNQFTNGARIFVLSDSCHSGTVTKNLEYTAVAQSDVFAQHYRMRSGPPRFRGIPENTGRRNYQENQSMYNALQFASGSRMRNTMDACVLLISGCQDNQLSGDGDSNGLFTGVLLNVWKNGGFTGNYKAFHQAILNQMPSTQTPKYFVSGASNPGFEAQKPFTVEAPSGGAESSGSAPDVSAIWPSIKGPENTTRGTPPVFQINAGPGRYFAAEVAIASNLFDRTNHANDQNENNFYGSWKDTALMQGNNYSLPPSVWQRLCTGGRLYYRILTCTNPSGWDDYRVSSGDMDGEAIPSIFISG
jgi:metacaspase-1